MHRTMYLWHRVKLRLTSLKIVFGEQNLLRMTIVACERKQ